MIAFTILGEAASKANSREIVTIKGRPASIKSAKARAWVAAAMLQIPPAARQMLAMPVCVTLVMHYATERPDLDESVVLDAMQAVYTRLPKRPGQKKADRVLVQRGIYLNDRQVREKHVYWRLDRTNPRVEVYVKPIEETPA